MLAEECMKKDQRHEHAGKCNEHGEHVPRKKSKENNNKHDDMLQRPCDREIVVDRIIFREDDVHQHGKDGDQSGEHGAQRVKDGGTSEETKANDNVVVEKDLDVVSDAEFGF